MIVSAIVRTYEEDEITVHKIPLMLMGGVVAISLALTASVSFGLFERQGLADEARAERGAMSVQTRSLKFFDEADGTVRVEDAFSGEVINRFGPGTGGFVRSSMRSLVHHRRIRGYGRAVPFELIEYEDGTMQLRDTMTDESVEVASFGESNRQIFADMFKKETR